MAKTGTASRRTHALDRRTGSNGSCASMRAQADVEALTSYLSDHRDQLRGYARTIVHDDSLAEDLVQQAYLNSLQALASGTKIENMSAWLHRVIHNLALREISRSRAEPLDQASGVASFRDTEAQVESREQLDAVRRVTDRMPDKLRAAFLLAEVRGFNHNDIAVALQSSTGSARQILHRARVRVRELAAVERLPLIGPLHALIVASRAGQWLRGLHEKAAAKLAGAGDWLPQVRQSVEQLAAPSAAPVTAVIAVAVVGGMAGANVQRGAGDAFRGMARADTISARPAAPAVRDTRHKTLREAASERRDASTSRDAAKPGCTRARIAGGHARALCGQPLPRRCGPGVRGAGRFAGRAGAPCVSGGRLRARAAHRAHPRRRPLRRSPGAHGSQLGPHPLAPKPPARPKAPPKPQPRPGTRPPAAPEPPNDQPPFSGPPPWPSPGSGAPQPPGGQIPPGGNVDPGQDTPQHPLLPGPRPPRPPLGERPAATPVE